MLIKSLTIYLLFSVIKLLKIIKKTIIPITDKIDPIDSI